VTDDTVTDDVVTDDTVTDEEPPSCEPSGSCVDDDAMDCEDDQPVERNCTGCALLVGCADCCHSLGYFAGTSDPFELMPELVDSFAHSETSAQIGVTFSALGEMAVISFNFDVPISLYPTDLYVVLQTAGMANGPVSVSFEDNSGVESGCAYNYFTEGDDFYYADEFVTCWGDWESFLPFDMVNVRTLNVRAESIGAGAGTLTVAGIEW
jgi:hypothetical protein